MSKDENKEQAKYNTTTELAMEEARKIINGEIEAKSYESINEILNFGENYYEKNMKIYFLQQIYSVFPCFRKNFLRPQRSMYLTDVSLS